MKNRKIVFILILSCFIFFLFGRYPAALPVGDLTITTSSQLPDASPGQYYQVGITAGGGSEIGYTWKIVSTDLPPDVLNIEGNNSCLNWGGPGAGYETTDDITGDTSKPCYEMSGIVASRKYPGVIWAQEDDPSADGGGGGMITAFEADTGIGIKTYRITGSYSDWEDIAMTPVDPANYDPGDPDNNAEYILIGMHGHNAAREDPDNTEQKDYQLVRVPEPDDLPFTPGVPPVYDPVVTSLASDRFHFQYPDRSWDCEALIVDWETGTPYLINKRSGGTNIYRFEVWPVSANSSESPYLLELIRSYTDHPDSMEQYITGADAGRDARRLVAISDRWPTERIWEWQRPDNEEFAEIFNPDNCTVTATELSGQYEAICFGSDGQTLYAAREYAGSGLRKWIAAAGESTTLLSGDIPNDPLIAGDYIIEIELRDSSGTRVTKTFNLSIQEPGVTITESGGSTDVTWGGETDSYTVVLDSQPVDDVTITVDPDDQTDVGGGGGVVINLTFTTGNWDQAQTVTVAAVNNGSVKGGHNSTITHIAASADAGYEGIPVVDVMVKIRGKIILAPQYLLLMLSPV